MVTIEIYDYEADKLEEAADRLGVREADLIEWLVEKSLDDVVEEAESL